MDNELNNISYPAYHVEDIMSDANYTLIYNGVHYYFAYT